MFKYQKFLAPTILIILICLIPLTSIYSGGNEKTKKIKTLLKEAGKEDRKSGIHDGNKILTIFFNSGCIGNWWGDDNRLQSGIWPKGSGHSYFAEFAPVVGAAARDTFNITRYIISDGLLSPSSPSDIINDKRVSFEPSPGYADPDQDQIAMSDDLDDDGPDKIPMSEDDDGKPDSWPWSWPDRPEWVDPRTSVPFWNGQYGAYSRADQESYFRMNDYDNDEFAFFPDSSDLTRRGLALEVEVRGYQWADPLAEDILIFTYWISNTGDVLYDKTVFGMYGDADIGEGSPNNQDDISEFNQAEDIVYQWDNDGWTTADGGYKTAYFGWKFLESPGNPLDGKDNDGDGLIGITGNPWDESQEDGIDNDGDWDPDLDDVGSDGKGPDHPDYAAPDPDGTEGNGAPDRGEPNFEYTDNDESDQIGLTSYKSTGWKAGIMIPDDPLTWSHMIPGTFDKPASFQDIVMLYGSGYFELPPQPDPNSRRKFAISMVLGMDRDDLIRNATTMQQIYDNDYNFARPPLKPNLWAVAGDRKVTLYWDKIAEKSRDPIYGFDFEGYVIYRSTDPGFIESNIITDTYGNPIFNKPVAQFDLADSLNGPHPIGLYGIQFNMGEDTGLEYVFVDSGQTWAGPVENGQTYFYAICSYDKGYDVDFYARGLTQIKDLQPHSPAICSKRINIDASGGVTFLDVNTVMVVPNSPAAGYIQPPDLKKSDQSVKQIGGTGTGEIVVHPLDPAKIMMDGRFQITFDDSTHEEQGDTTFYVKDLRVYTDTVAVDTNFVLLSHKNIDPSSVSVKLVEDPGKEFTINNDYFVGFELGNIRALSGGALPYQDSTQVHEMAVSYQYYPIVDSPYIRGESGNDFFDGLHLYVYNDPLRASQARSQWLSGDSLQYYMAKYGLIGPDDPLPQRNLKTPNYTFRVTIYTNNPIAVPYDYHIVFYDSIVSKSVNNKWCNFKVFNITTGDTSQFVFGDAKGDTVVSDGDEITPTIVVSNRPRGTWLVKFWEPDDIIITRDSLDASGNPITKDGDTLRILVDTVFVEKIAPKPGDIFHLAVDKPFSSKDVFEFTTNSYQMYFNKEQVQSRSELDAVAVVPNPYVVTASWEAQHFYSSGRGIRKIDFIHLPPRCTIKIFTLRGYLVDTIEHDSAVTDGAESWDLLSKDGMEIAYGVYFFHVSTPSGEERIGKFAVIK